MTKVILMFLLAVNAAGCTIGAAAEGGLQQKGALLTGVAQYPINEAGTVIGTCISVVGGLKQQMNGSPAVP